MSIPEDARISQTHEWHRVEGNLVTVGITQFAADELTDITFVDLPETGATVEAGGAFGEIESVKATSEMFCAVGGTVLEVNAALADQPELVNDDPFGKGWMIRVSTDDTGPLDVLLDKAGYEKMTSS